MLQAFVKDSWVPIINRSKYYIDYQYGGQHKLFFSLPVNYDLCNELLEEVLVKEDKENNFLIKKVNRVGNYIDYQCELDLDDFKNRMYKSTKDLEQFKTKTLGQILTAIIPSGWKVINAGIRIIKRTIELEGITDFDILFKCEEIFDVVFDINTMNKTINVIDPNSFEYDGLYIHRDLNLKTYSMTGDSSMMITRLYCEGKEGLTFSSINNGKDYIDNMSYKNKVISAFWKDERYTIAEDLLADGKKKLEELSIPKKSYVFNVVDLASVNKEYDFLSISLYKKAKVIVNENLSIFNQIVKYRKYLDDNEMNRNIVTLSNEPQTLGHTISTILGGEIKNPVKGSILEQAQKESAQIINEFATKGYRYETENETYFLDKLPKEAAKYVMRMNLGGIAFSQSGWSGPYTTAWTIDGKFNAEFITTGVLKAIKIESSEIYGGKINGGSIDGTTIKGSTFVVEKKRTVKVYAGEPEQLMNYILGTGTLTEEQKQRLDINQNGRIDSLDYYLAMEIYSGRVSGNFIDTITINNDNIPQITLRTTNGKNEYKTIIKTGSVTTSDFDSTYATIKSIETNNISFLNSDSRIGVGDLNDVRTLMVSGFNLPTYIDGSSIECNGNNSLRCNRAWQVTSDKRLKHDIDDVPKEFIDIWLNLQPKMFRLNNSSNEIMIGLLAQDVIKEFEKVGLDYMDYDFIGEFMIDNSGEKYFSVSYDFYFILTSLFTKRLYEDVEKMKEKLK